MYPFYYKKKLITPGTCTMINQITEVLARGVELKNAACFIVKNVLNTKQNKTLENRNEGVCYAKKKTPK